MRSDARTWLYLQPLDIYRSITFPVKPIPIDPDQTLTQRFKGVATLTQAGTNFIEGFVFLIEPCLYGPCTLPGEVGKPYSWQTGSVVVPNYDVRSIAQGTTAQGNLGGGDNLGIKSWHVD